MNMFEFWVAWLRTKYKDGQVTMGQAVMTLKGQSGMTMAEAFNVARMSEVRWKKAKKVVAEDF